MRRVTFACIGVFIAAPLPGATAHSDSAFKGAVWGAKRVPGE